MSVEHPPPPPAWVAPVEPATIVRAFRTAPPYAAGGHRGIDLLATPGAVVRAPCSGRVTFRGAVAGGPPTVTIGCGRLRATLQRLEPTAQVGELARRGSAVGRALGPALDLSARTLDGTYRDPALLLGVGAVPAPPIGALPRRSSRPPATRAPVQARAHLSERALVRPSGADWSAAASARQGPRVDRVLGGAGSALGAVLLVAWLRGRRRPGGRGQRWRGGTGPARARR